MAQIDQPRHGLVAGSRFGHADGLADHQEAPPGLEAGILGGEELLIGDGLVPGPEAARRSEVRDAALGGDAGAGEDDSTAGALDHAGQFIYLFFIHEVTP